VKRYIPLLATIAVFVLITGAAALRYPGFLSVGMLVNLLRDNAVLGVVAVGMKFVILSGGIDLSVGAVVGFTSIAAATLVEKHHVPVLLAIPGLLALGTAFGAGMGWVIARFSLPPFLVTLAGMFLARGLGFVVSVESISLTNPFFIQASGLPWALPALFVTILTIGGLVLAMRPLGRNIYAIGGNEASSLLMGLPVRRTKISVYAISGFCAALAGIGFSLYTSAGNASAATGLELDAIASVVIGGTLLSGGVGSVVGTFFGVLLLGVIQTAISFEGTLSSWWTKIVTGVLLMGFILLQRLFQGRSDR